MDPNVTLQELRALISERAQVDDAEGTGKRERLAEAIIERFEALDQWLTKGGFAPNDWLRPPRLEVKNG